MKIYRASIRPNVTCGAETMFSIIQYFGEGEKHLKPMNNEIGQITKEEDIVRHIKAQTKG